MERYIPTGNEYVSLPEINEENCTAASISFLLMSQRGMVELRGNEKKGIIEPFITVNDTEISLNGMEWDREHFWVPVARKKYPFANVSVKWCAPVGERGFMLRIEAEGVKPGSNVTIGVRGAWNVATHCVNEDKPLEGTMHCYESGWNNGIIFDYRMGYPAFAFAPMCDKPVRSSYQVNADGVDYSFATDAVVSAEGKAELTVFWGFGFEEVAAATSAKEMLRRGWYAEYKKTADYLVKREKKLKNEWITRVYNTNLFFCIFYATGLTLDTEELICATSRSKRYYVSAAYWDRDTLLWAFPAILDADPGLARDILEYVFTRQGRNIGVHSRYIDGLVLEPGFELDELLAPVIALEAYTEKTGDTLFKTERFVTDRAERILEKLSEMKHPVSDLYETFLQPTDDERVYPYLTYDNVLVWKAMRALAGLYPEKYAYLSEEAEKVRSAVYDNCVFTGENSTRYFGWSVDLEGHHDIYDEPPGSLQLLPYYGFCSFDDEIWLNTVAMIRSPEYKYSFADYPIAEIGCPHAPYPWILSLSNSMLCGYREKAFRELESLKMDNGIACESVDAVTGECMTGAAFATCAGFLCHAILYASEVNK